MPLEFLDAIPSIELARLARGKAHSSQRDLIDSLERRELLNVINSLFSFSALNDEGVRQLFFQFADEQKILELASRMECDVSKSRYELSLELTTKAWGFGSKLVQELRDSLRSQESIYPIAHYRLKRLMTS